MGAPLGRYFRAQAGRRLGREAKRVEDAGTEVVLIQPVAEDLEVMGENLMASARRQQVTERARQTTAWQLRALGDRLAGLPTGAAPFLRASGGGARDVGALRQRRAGALPRGRLRRPRGRGHLRPRW